jgi:dihydrolipoamide dehydrogenase
MVVGEFTREADVVVLGGGPGGYAAAFRAAELGMGVVLVDDRADLGGVCLHEGCIPSKIGLHVAHTLNEARQAARFGVHFAAPRVDLDELRAWLGRCVSQLAGGLRRTAERLGVEVVRGSARFEEPRCVAVPGSETPRLRFKHAVVATGSRPRPHPVLAPDGQSILTPGQAVGLAHVGQRVLVVGSGYMPVELASTYAALGAAVTIVSPAESLLPEADADLERPLMRRLSETMAAVAVRCNVTAAAGGPGGVRVEFTGPEPPAAAEFDQVIVAHGMVGNTDDLHLDRAGLATDHEGCLGVDEQLRTASHRILAVGDVTGPPRLADRALHQGRVAAEVIAGWGSVYEPRSVPMVVFTDPQVAWCGLTERGAAEQGIAVAVCRIPWGASGRAIGIGRNDGVTKIVYDPDTQLVLGVGLVGPGAAELIAEGALAIEMGAELTDLAETIHPHPTMSELLADAARTSTSRRADGGGR